MRMVFHSHNATLQLKNLLPPQIRNLKMMNIITERHVRTFMLIFTFLLTNKFTAFSQSLPDTAISAKEQTNTSFNTIYRQTVDPGFFGNEYGNLIMTSLVADINPNVALLNSSQLSFSHFFRLELNYGYSMPIKLR